jgi:hypothetical protein
MKQKRFHENLWIPFLCAEPSAQPPPSHPLKCVPDAQWHVPSYNKFFVKWPSSSCVPLYIFTRLMAYTAVGLHLSSNCGWGGGGLLSSQKMFKIWLYPRTIWQMRKTITCNVGAFGKCIAADETLREFFRCCTLTWYSLQQVQRVCIYCDCAGTFCSLERLWSILGSCCPHTASWGPITMCRTAEFADRQKWGSCVNYILF